MEFTEHRQPLRLWIRCVDDWVSSIRAHGDTSATIERWWYLVIQFALFIGEKPEGVQM